MKTEAVKTSTPTKAPIVTSTAPARQPASPERVAEVEKAFAPFLDKLGPQPQAEEPATSEENGDAKVGIEAPAKAAPSDATPTTKTPEQLADERQLAILDEKLKALRENNAAKIQRQKVSQQEAQFEARRKAHEEEVAKLRSRGIDPNWSDAQIHEHLQNKALAEKDPVLRNAMLLEEERRERKALEKKLADIEQREVQRENMTQRQQVQNRILGITKDPKYALLHEYMLDDSEMLNAVDHAADSLRARVGDTFSESDVVNEMLRVCTERDTRKKARSGQSNGTSPNQPSGQSDPPQVAANPLNPALSDRRDSGQRPLSPKERAALVERQMEPWLKRKGYRSDSE